jgi:poly-gamma-glutamate synthesis protein (capsule biosynthesis protein)
MVGDVMLGRLVNEALRSRPPEFPWGDVVSLFHSSDWRFCNLECVVSDLVPDRLPPKTFHFRSDARNVAVLQAAGVDAVSCANNHGLDFGRGAMLDMLRILEDAGIAHAGAGSNLEEARRPALTTTRGGTRVALIACTDNQPDWAAGALKPGVFFVPADVDLADASGLLGLVDKTRRVADLVVVSLHWGANWGYEPEAGHRELARALVELGAGVVFGHSCHVFRGVEVYREAPIVYSAADFVDDYAIDPVDRNDWSFVHLVETWPGNRRLRLRPTMIENMHARLAHGAEATAIISRMSGLCNRLGTRLRVEGEEAVISLTPAAAGG